LRTRCCGFLSPYFSLRSPCSNILQHAMTGAANPLYRQSMPNTAELGADSDFARRLSNVRGFSNNPRWKRHLSLDAGVGQFRSRRDSMYDGEYSPLSTPDYDGSEEKPLLSPWGSPMRPVFDLEDRKKKSKLRQVLSCLLLLLLGALGAVVLSNRPEAEGWWGMRSKLEEYGLKLAHVS
jgi:hypothetical protein